MPGWTGRADVNTGDVGSAADHNTQIDNEEYLYNNSKLLIAETIVGAAVTNVDFASLTAYEFFDLELAIYNPTGGNASYYLFFNADYTLTNYYSQYTYSIGATIGAALSNAPNIVANVATLTQAAGTVDIRNVRKAASTFTYPRFSVLVQRNAPASLVTEIQSGAWNTEGQISSIRVNCGTASGIGIGSRFRLLGK